MATVEMGRAKWERKMQSAGANWKAGVSGKRSALADGLRAAGASPGERFLGNWQAGVDATSADQFQQSVSGKGNKWQENFLRGVSQ